VGSTREDLIDALCCADAPTRAVAYEAIGGYHGMINFDQYPDTWQNWPPERA
jgi:hypothetical protein